VKINEFTIGEKIWILQAPMAHRRTFCYWSQYGIVTAPPYKDKTAWKVPVRLLDGTCQGKIHNLSITRIKKIR
jgi:hypothetical protein